MALVRAHVQAVALPPDVLAAIVRQAVETEIDYEAYVQALHYERQQREQLSRWSESLASITGG